MSTHSYIAIENDDGDVSYVYCYFDGYLAGVGVDVVHLDRAKTKSLVEGGDMSCVGKPYSERGEHCPPKSAINVAEFKSMVRMEGIEYTYLLTKAGEWKFCREDGIMCSLLPALEGEGLLNAV